MKRLDETDALLLFLDSLDVRQTKEQGSIFQTNNFNKFLCGIQSKRAFIGSWYWAHEAGFENREKKNVFTCREPYPKLQCRINEEKNDENKYIVKCNPETGEKAQGTSS